MRLLSLGVGIGGVLSNPIAKGLAELRKFGANAHLYLPGPGIPILGPELVSNGDFGDGANGWTPVEATLTVVNGEAVLQSIGSVYGRAIQSFEVVSGKEYCISVAHRNGTTNDGWLLVGSASGAYDYWLSSILVGNSNATFVAKSNTLHLAIQNDNLIANAISYHDNISVREIIGYSNKISGITAGNYFDSIGTTHASVDGLVGLVLDAAGSVGPELVNNGSFSGATGWSLNAGTGTASISGGAANVLSPGGSFVSIYANPQFTIKIGSTYSLEFEVTQVTGAGPRIDFANVTGTAQGSVGRKRVILTAVGAGALSVVRGAGAGSGGSITNISVKEITGIHASQATTGNKPTLRRGLVNLLTWSDDLTNAAWLRTNATVGVAVADPDGGTNAKKVSFVYGAGPITRIYQDYGTAVNGAKYTFSILLRSDTPCQMNLGIQRSGPADVEQTVINITTTWQMFVFSHSGVFTGSSAVRGVLYSIAPGFSANVEVYRPGLFAGTLTAEQILAAAGIPLTTTAPASSSVGACYWETASQDHLSLGSPLFGIEDDHFVVAGGERTDAPGNQGLFCPAASAIWGRTASIQYDGSGPLTAVYLDDAVANSRVIVGNPLPPDTPFIASILAVGGVAKLRRDGNEEGTPINLLGLGAITPNAAYIGKGANGGDFWQGKIYPALAVKGTVTTAQALIFERMINALSGYAAGRF